MVEKPWELKLRKQYGLEWQQLGRDELKAMEPAVELGDGAALLDPTWHHLLDPGAATAAIAENAIAQGVTWINDRVETLQESGNGVTVTTDKGKSIEADRVVIAAGAWSGRLLAPLGYKVPVTSKRGYHSMVVKPNLELNHPLMGVTAFFVMTPMLEGIRVAGTAEFASLEAPPDYRRARALMHHAHQFLPDLAGEEVREWMGHRPMMPDSLPVIGPLEGHKRVICAFGHGHYGLTQGPTTGRIVADLVQDRPTHIELGPFSPGRFSAKVKDKQRTDQ
jgi:D-amino-acid dehydrogenase